MVGLINELDVDILRLKRGLDDLDAKVIIANEDHVVVYANNSAITFLNYAEDEIRKDFPNFSVDGVLGKKIEDFHKNPVYQKRLIGNLKELLRTNFKVGSLTLSVKATPIMNNVGQRIGFMAEIEDVTERENKKIELFKANKKNLILNKQVSQMQRVESISRLTAGISHDFNNILGAVIGYNQLSRYIANECQNEKLKEELLFNLDQVGIASERGINLIKKMMTYSRQNVDDTDIEVKATYKVIEEVLSLMRPALTSAFSINAIIDTTLDVQIDSTELHQILTNLIVNARDAMKRGGNIQITLKEIAKQDMICNACVQMLNDRFIELSVVDNGTGIDSNVIDNIFEPFFTTKGVGEGTGLGLATVSGMVHEADGHIVVESKTFAPNTGTAFRLLFPISKTA